ncbi:RHS repeat-associated core domain-containing protein [Bacterioplanoides pacificum]|uniref:RHS repeat-associated core domain-containing protein n=1 Tax=Bacterioplanoides pacificum TaxID=1171596 RepID=A0ABV7VM41_9GAMM
MKVLHTFFILFALILATGLSPLAQAKDRVQYFHSDLSGSPVAATNTDGELLWEESYTPFGQRLKQSATDNTIGFTGKPEEAHLGLQYFGARWYHQASGRFISRDPASVLAHVESNPMMFNRYAYANNNPYRYVDPDGRSPVGAAGILGVIYGVYKVSSVTVDGLSIARDIYVGNYIGATITAVGMLDPSGATNKLRNINRGMKVTNKTVKQQYRELADQAIAKTKTNANPTVTRNGKDIFRVHKPGSGHGDKVTQNVMNGPPGNKTFPGTKDVNVRASHNRKLQKALNREGGYELRYRNGKIVE